MSPDEFSAIDTAAQPWDERHNPKLGRAILRKDLYTDPETGAEIRLVRYPAGLVNPAHTHPCGHGLYVLEGDLVTHKGTFGPGTFVWLPGARSWSTAPAPRPTSRYSSSRTSPSGSITSSEGPAAWPGSRPRGRMRTIKTSMMHKY